MWQVADDTIIGSKITKKKAEKLLEGDATFDGKVLQLNEPPTEKEKTMASSSIILILVKPNLLKLLTI